METLCQSLRFHRFCIDFETPWKVKNKQNHWRVVQNQGFERSQKNRHWEHIFIDFGLHFGHFWEYVGHSGRLIRQKSARERGYKSHRFSIDIWPQKGYPERETAAGAAPPKEYIYRSSRTLYLVPSRAYLTQHASPLEGAAGSTTPLATTGRAPDG